VNPLVVLEKREPIAVVTLNRPERHNSLVPALLEEMLWVWESLRMQPEFRAAVVLANGRSFSTGGDLAGFYDHMEELESYASTIVGLLNKVILAMLDLPIPIVGGVHGIVTGGALGLVLACDVVLVAPGVSFTPYYSVVGFSPDGGWTAMLPDIIGLKRAAEVLMDNRTITAEQAVAWGLASRCVPPERIRDEALGAAQRMAKKSAGSISRTKELFRSMYGNVAGRLELERAQFARQIMTQEAQQGIQAFLNGKRRRAEA
jgi:2-(1,2-epoxy-1,2-dihydrophenyl)acetyl-CoA isomerase